ncbi:unnamed protein product [Musa acuminata var. zebrina]
MQINDEMQHSGLRAWKWEKGYVSLSMKCRERERERERGLSFVYPARSRLRKETRINGPKPCWILAHETSLCGAH